MAFDAGDWLAAAADYRAASDSLDLSLEAAPGEARSLWRLGRRAEALAIFERAARQAPAGHPEAWAWLGAAAAAAGDARLASAALPNLRRPVVADARSCLLALAGDFRGADAAAARADAHQSAALELSPHDARLWLARGRSLIWMGRRFEASRALDRARALGYRPAELAELEKAARASGGPEPLP